MVKKFKQVVTLGLVGSLMLTGCGSTSQETTTDSAQASTETTGEETTSNVEETGEPIVVRFGSHNANGMNPYYKDPITGEYAMNELDREMRIAAEEKVLNELNVKIEWVHYAGETTEVLLQSVMANDPVADVVNLYANSQGTILGQNILQPLDEYMDAFVTPPAQIYGKQYFVQVDGDGQHPLSPLFYNIDYIEAVDALKVDGETVYPTDLYLSGEWTWSVFEDYLAKIDAHYANAQGPERPEMGIEAYRTDYTETLIQAMHSAGGSIYGAQGSEIDSPETIEAVNFVQDLIERGLLVCEIIEGTSIRPYNAQGQPFELGESVFTNIEDWRGDGAANKLTERGQSMGFVPFPRPDHMEFDDPEYRQVRTGGETWGILKGTDPEIIPAAIQACEMYLDEWGKLLNDSQSLGGEKRIPIKIDLFHEEIGVDLAEIYYDSTDKTVVNEFANMTGVYWTFMQVAGDAIFGINGSSNYEAAIASNGSVIEEKIAQTESILNSSEVRDNIAPVFTQVEEGKTYTFEKGTDPASIEWTKEFTVSDNIDGELDATTAVYDATATDFNTVGVYTKGVIGKMSDSSGNEGTVSINIVIFDGANTTVPTLTIKPEYRTIKVDEDSSRINWAGDFVEMATDKDGLDLKAKVVADLSELDTTTVGEYNVSVSVTDYVGNTSTQTIVVSVVAE